MSSKRKLSTSSSKSKVSFDSTSINYRNEKSLKDNLAYSSSSNNNYVDLREKPRSWMTSYNAGSHFPDDSTESDSLPKRISNSNTPRESCVSTLETDQKRKRSRSGSLEGLKRGRKTSPTQSGPESIGTKISSSVFEHKRRGYSLINFFTLRILFIDMVIAVGDPISDFMQVGDLFIGQIYNSAK